MNLKKVTNFQMSLMKKRKKPKPTERIFPIVNEELSSPLSKFVFNKKEEENSELQSFFDQLKKDEQSKINSQENITKTTRSESNEENNLEKTQNDTQKTEIKRPKPKFNLFNIPKFQPEISVDTAKNIENNEVRQERKIQFHSNIQFQDVSFAYADNQVLQHLSVTIEKGKKYLVIGSSGCGKSTFLKLIARYYDCQSGTISIDQKNIKNYSSSEIDEIMTIMNQNVYMMNDTLKNNITLLNDNYDEQELKKVISICGLNDLVQRLPNKENELIIEDGNNFSGGEKQRIALARTIIRKTPILLLDEFSSALDETNSIDIERIILEMKDITLINVSHKINSINLAQYDSVLYFNNKSCIEMAVDEENICKIEQLKEKME